MDLVLSIVITSPKTLLSDHDQTASKITPVVLLVDLESDVLSDCSHRHVVIANSRSGSI